MKPFGIIYKHTNRVNGKVYIGQTIHHKNPNKRFRKGTFRAYQGSTAFYNALIKYTWEGFETELVYTAFTQEDLNRAEELFIGMYESLLPKGYNSVNLVEGNIQYTAEVKKKMSESTIKYYANLEVIPEAVNKKHYTIIDGVEYKHCSECNTKHPLVNFGKNSNRWDKLSSFCKRCHKKVNYRAYVRKSEEEVKESYKTRINKTKVSLKKAYEDRPELRALISKQRSKAVVASHAQTKKEIEFKSALEAKQYGFDNAGISRALKSGKIYKNHLWRFKS